MHRIGWFLCIFVTLTVFGVRLLEAQTDPAAAAPDRVVLRDGTVLRGQIEAADAETVVLVFAFGGRVEFQRKDLRSIHRGERPEPSAVRPDAEPDRDAASRGEQRFLVFHGETLVGFRTVVQTRALRRGRDGVLRKDEVVFYEVARSTGDAPAETDEPEEPCRVVRLEFVADDEAFRTCYYREAGRGTDNIVDATLQGDQLEYTWVRAGRRSFHRVRIEPDVVFPLAFWWEVARSSGRIDANPGAIKVWDPRERKVTEIEAMGLPERKIVVGRQKLRVVPVRVREPRGERLRWLGANGWTLKETLNGVSLVAVNTSRTDFPGSDLHGLPARLPAERAMAGTFLDPDSGLVVSSPAPGWIRTPTPRPGSWLTLLNPELRASMAVYRGEAEGPWPGPEPGPGCRVQPVRFGGWPGEGWHGEASPGTPETVVRRMKTTQGRVTVVLETPRELASAVVMDFTKVLRDMQVPGAGGRAGEDGRSGSGRPEGRHGGSESSSRGGP